MVDDQGGSCYSGTFVAFQKHTQHNYVKIAHTLIYIQRDKPMHLHARIYTKLHGYMYIMHNYKIHHNNLIH